jgi:4-hydroxy-tetrahydrodipicolinate synthase
LFATANPSVGGFDVSISAIFIGCREAMTQRIRGVLAPVVTPFKGDLAPDSQRFIAHCKWLLSQNCGLAVFGTNSDSNSLSVEERAMLLDELVAAGA